MGCEDTGIDGIVLDSRGLAWIDGTRVKVIHIARRWDGRTLPAPELWLAREQILAALLYYERNKVLCDEQIRRGEDSPVFNFWTEGRKNSSEGAEKLYDAFMIPTAVRDSYILLSGSLLARDFTPPAGVYEEHRDDLVRRGALVDNGMTLEVVEDIPFPRPQSRRSQGLREMSTWVTGHPNCGTDTRSKAQWIEDVRPHRTLADWLKSRR